MSGEIQEQTEKNIPLCVDLDGTLISTDSLMESILLLIKSNPLNIFLLFIWLARGRAFLKSKVFNIAKPDVSRYFYRTEVIDFLAKEKQSGRQIILATASSQMIADSVAAHLNLFSKVIGSDSEHNLRSNNKRKKLVELFGEKGFDYIGDSKADIPVWKSARYAYMVNPTNALINSAKKRSDVKEIFGKSKPIWKQLIKEIRVYQWLKNILVFLPLMMAHKISDTQLLINVLIAFFGFSLTASFVYVLNDLLDIESDRLHPTKRNRPIASGNLPILYGLVIAPLILLIGILLSLYVGSTNYLISLLAYLVLTTAYSFFLKRVVILDVIILACLYTLRLIAGAAAVDVVVSPWLFAFAIFFFLSLAIMKRYTEILVMKQNNQTLSKSRAYLLEDEPLLRGLGVVSGCISVLVLALYINSNEVTVLYNHPELLWLAALCHLYWISRLWIIAHRGDMEDDPIIFIINDPISYVIGVILILLGIGATI